MHINDEEEQIILQIREEGEYCLGKVTLYYCQYCECMRHSKANIINGRVGHVDNWLPDEIVIYCAECDRSME